MSYIKRSGVEAGTPSTTGAGGVLGSGETTAKTGQQSIANQSPTGFYNIQDFLKANQGQSTLAGDIQKKGEEAIGQQKNTLAQNQSTMENMPTATEYTPEALQKNLQANEYDALRGNIAQKPQTQQQIQSQLSANITNPFENMKAGDYKSIMDFFGQSQPTSSKYTQGMQKQDELLLRGNKESANIPTNLQNMYQEQVANPLNQAVNARTAKSAADVAKANEGWKGGLQAFLSSQDQLQKDILAEQQGLYNKAMSPQFASQNVGLQAPNANTALTAYMGGVDRGGNPYSNYEDYNPIREILGMTDVTNPQEVFNPVFGMGSSPVDTVIEQTPQNYNELIAATPTDKQELLKKQASGKAFF